ncbi:MAG: beta-galactosidase trimerization domain-containing protein, partial [Lentisphaeria bacterium]
DHELKVAVKTLQTSPLASAQIVIRDRNSAKKEANFSWPLQSAADVQTFSCPLPDLKHGEHLLTLHLMDTQNRVLNWKTIQLNTTSKVILASMKFSSDFRKVGENIEANIRLETASTEKLPVVLTARWWDVFGRLAGYQNQKLTVSAPGVDRKICLPLTHSYSAFNQLEVTVTTEADVVYDTVLKPFFIALSVEQRWDNYPVLMWHEGSFQHEYAMTALKNMGVDSLFCYQPDKILQAGLNFHGIGIYRQHLADKDFEEACKTMIRKPCMRDPAYRNLLKKSMNGTAAAWAKFSPLFYSIGDENSLTGYENQCDICISQYCLPAFRDWLLQEYGSLEAINAAWDSSFESIDTLLPLNISQARERKNQNFAPWADHRSFMDTVFSDTMMFCRNEMKKFDPDTPVGECGTSRDAAYGGWNWYKRLQVWEALGPYSVYGDQLQIQRSFTDVPFAGYSGYRDGKFGLYCNWWWALLNGENGISLWYTPLFLNPDFTSTLMGEAIEEYAKGELKKGIGKLVSKSRLLRDGIAIHYSQASLQCAYILHTIRDGNTLKQYYDNRHQWLTLLTNNGLRGRFVASEQIENGELENAGYRLLLLPLSWALSDQEAENIRRFVNHGGIVIADRSAGLYDQHLKKRATGVLDNLFGITRRLPEESLVQPLELSWRDRKILLDSCEPLQVADDIEHGTIASRGKVLGDYQINFGNGEECYAGMAIHKTGKGKAIYLNVQPNSLKQTTNLLMNIVSEEAAVKSQVVVAKDGNIVPGLEISRFQCGDIELLGIMQMPAAIGINPKTVTKEEMLALGYPADLSFMHRAHLYDVRKGCYLGFASRCQQQIAPGEALLIALSPYRIEKVDIKLTRNQLKAGEKIEIHIARTPIRGSGVVRIEVFTPQGKLSESYTTNPSLQEGITDLALHTAINDPIGKWTIVAKDIISGLAVETSFELHQ